MKDEKSFGSSLQKKKNTFLNEIFHISAILKKYCELTRSFL